MRVDNYLGPISLSTINLSLHISSMELIYLLKLNRLPEVFNFKMQHMNKRSRKVSYYHFFFFRFSFLLKTMFYPFLIQFYTFLQSCNSRDRADILRRLSYRQDNLGSLAHPLCFLYPFNSIFDQFRKQLKHRSLSVKTLTLAGGPLI